MARTLGDLKEWSLAALHEDPEDETFTDVLVPQWTRSGVDKVLTYTYWNWNTGICQLTWPASTGEYAALYLPEYVDKILSCYPGTEEGVGSIDIIQPYEIDRHRPGLGTRLGRDFLVLYGWYWVERDMPAAGTVTATSSVGGTDDGLVVRLEGRDTNGREVRENLTLSGGTATSTRTFASGVDGLRRVSITAGAGGLPTLVGTGIVTVSSGGTDLAVLDSAWEKFQEHQRTELYTTASATTYTCRFFRHHRRIEDDDDFLPIPEGFEDTIEHYLEAQIGQFRKQPDEYMNGMGEFQARRRELLAWDRRQPGRRRHARVRKQWGFRR